MNPGGAPQTFWLVQDNRGAPTWVYLAKVYATGHQLEQTQDPERALRFSNYNSCLAFIQSQPQLTTAQDFETSWMAVEYIRYSPYHWVRVTPNQNT